MRRNLFILLGVLALSGCKPEPVSCEIGDPFPYKSPYNVSGCPPDIKSYMDRVNACGHFGGEEPYDAERAKFLNEQMVENACARLACDYDNLFKKYEGDIVYTGILSQYTERVFGKIDGLPGCPVE
jgi:hypothetical protein